MNGYMPPSNPLDKMSQEELYQEMVRARVNYNEYGHPSYSFVKQFDDEILRRLNSAKDMSIELSKLRYSTYKYHEYIKELKEELRLKKAYEEGNY